MSKRSLKEKKRQPCYVIFILKDEHQDKKGSQYDTTDFQTVIVKDIPQQMNGSDCGMFACKVRKQ